MTPEEARKFEYYSGVNARILKAICDKCKPYKDWFTYKRWLAQKEQVAKGQKGTQLVTYVEREIKDKKGEIQTETIRQISTVFCRHQLSN